MSIEQADSDTAHRSAHIPRTSIAGFALAPATRETLKAVFADRLMARTTPELHDGGLDGAIQHYRTTGTPDILIVESGAEGPALFSAIDALANVSNVNTSVILIGQRNDVLLFRELVSRGVSDYLVAPVSARDLFDSLIRLAASAAEQKPARVIAFIGAGGGTGSSSVAQNVATLVAARPQGDTVLMDLDLGFGSAALNMDITPPQTIADALAEAGRIDGKALDRLLVGRGEHLRLLASPATLAEGREFRQDDLLPLLDALRFEARTIVLDLPAAMTPLTRAALALSDHVVITALPNLLSLRNAQSLAQYCLRLRPSDPPPSLVLNRTGVPGERQLGAAEFERVMLLKPVAEIPFAPDLFSASMAASKLVVEQPKAGGRTLARLRQVADAVMPVVDLPTKRGKAGGLARLLGRRG